MTRARLPLACLASAALALGALPARAQTRGRVGSGAWAMPSLGRVLVASESETGVDAALVGGWGATEDVLGVGDSHQRAEGSVALAGRPLSWLTFAGRLDGRWDHHLLAGNDDQSAVGEARLAVRGDTSVAPGLALGLAAMVFVPGSDAPSLVFDATTGDVRALGSYTLEGVPLTLALDLGWRFDRTARAAPRPIPFGRGDLVSLGASDSDALLLSGGALVHLDETELFAEVSADLLLFANALGGSPVRVGVGVRTPIVADLLSFYASAEALVSGRLAVDPSAVLTPVEPRVTLRVGLVLSPRAGPAAVVRDDDAAWPPRVEGRVLDPSGSPLAGATVRPVGATAPTATTQADGRFVLEGVHGDTPLEVVAEGYVTTTLAPREGVVEATLERALPSGALRGLVRGVGARSVHATILVEPGGAQAETDADGVFELALAPGRYEVTIDAPGYQRQERTVEVEVGGVTVINADLRRAH
jgi:hypothetical protein